MLTHRFTVRQTFRSSRASSAALLLLPLVFLLFSLSLLAPLPPPRPHLPAAPRVVSRSRREWGGGKNIRKRKETGEKARNIGACAVVDSLALSLILHLAPAPLSIIRGERQSEYERVATEGAGCPCA